MADNLPNNDITSILNRLLAERLEQFEVPVEIRNSLRDELMALFQRPERKPFGACVQTAEASMAADLARVNRKTQEGGAVPKIM